MHVGRGWENSIPTTMYTKEKSKPNGTMPAVSIVIPVYNIGKYLEKCLDSVVAQTFPDIEIIVVNDGSTDNSPEIIARYADKDSRIVVIDKSNEGLAYARKSGIEAARGTYIYHLDGDDYLELDAIELLYRKAKEEDADMVVFPFSLDYVDEKKKRSSRPAPGVYDSVSFFQSMAFCRNYWSVCSYLHKRSLYAEVHFEKGLNYGEDAYLASQLTYFANKIVVLESHPLLHYVIRNDSISFGSFSEKNRIISATATPVLPRQTHLSPSGRSSGKCRIRCDRSVIEQTVVPRSTPTRPKGYGNRKTISRSVTPTACTTLPQAVKGLCP